jgi:prepilin-type N-terminal cleavage/methylation domain-containing protein
MNHDNKGFTLIELMLAMSFLAVLLLAIAMTVIQIGNIYNRGLTLKEVNQTGRALSTELKRGIAQTPSFAINYPTAGSKYVNSTWGGRLCISQYSYIWNYGVTIKDTSANASNSNVYTAGLSSEKIRFIKVSDPSGQYCSNPAMTIDPSGAVELLDEGDRDLAVHSFMIGYDPSGSDALTGQRIYTISFVLGTNDQAALSANRTDCRTPDDIASDLTYCSVYEFKITARTSNAVE